MLQSPPSSLGDRKSWLWIAQATRRPSPPLALGTEERGILSRSSQTGSMGPQLTAVWLLCWVIII